MTVREIFSDDKTYSPIEFAQKFCVKETAALPIYDHESLEKQILKHTDSKDEAV